MPVRPATPDDAAAVADIYNYYIAHTHTTFEVHAVDAHEILRRMENGWAENYPFFVCETSNEVIGYAYGHTFRPRPAYRGTVEVSVYIKSGCERRSLGSQLYERLIVEIGNGGFHTVIAGIALPNDASVRLHERFGFVQVGHFREVGRKFNRWIDVGYWQKILQK